MELGVLFRNTGARCTIEALPDDTFASLRRRAIDAIFPRRPHTPTTAPPPADPTPDSGSPDAGGLLPPGCTESRDELYTTANLTLRIAGDDTDLDPLSETPLSDTALEAGGVLELRYRQLSVRSPCLYTADSTICGAELSRDGDRFALSTATGASLWETETGKRLWHAPLSGGGPHYISWELGSIRPIALSPCGTLLAVSGLRTPGDDDSDAGGAAPPPPPPTGSPITPCASLLCTHAGSLICSAAPPRHTEGDLRSLCFSACSQRLVGGFSRNTVRVWDVSDGACLHKLHYHTGPVFKVLCTAEGRVASGSGDKRLIIWDLASGETLQDLDGHTKGITGIAVAESRGVLISASKAEARVWDMESWRCAAILQPGGRGVCYAPKADSPNGLLATLQGEGVLSFWRPPSFGGVEYHETVCEGAAEPHQGDGVWACLTPCARWRFRCFRSEVMVSTLAVGVGRRGRVAQPAVPLGGGAPMECAPQPTEVREADQPACLLGVGQHAGAAACVASGGVMAPDGRGSVGVIPAPPPVPPAGPSGCTEGQQGEAGGVGREAKRQRVG